MRTDALRCTYSQTVDGSGFPEVGRLRAQGGQPPRPRRGGDGRPPGWGLERAQAWRPYRTWVVLLLRVLLETETGEIGGTRNVGGCRP
jgi:hypothetical protein